MAPSHRELGLAEDEFLLGVLKASNHLVGQPSGRRPDPGCYEKGDPLLLAYWPAVRTNRFQSLLYNQAWNYNVAAVPAGRSEDFAAELPWTGSMACHFHWLASIKDEAELARFTDLLTDLKRQRRVIVWTVHNVLPHGDEAEIGIAVRVRRLMAETADLIHVMNPRTPELVEPHFSLAGKPTFFSPHPSYLGAQPSSATREAARFELGIGMTTTVFLVFGAIRPYKGIEDVLAAAQVLMHERPQRDFTVVVAGIPKDKELVRRLRQIGTLGERLVLYPKRVVNDDLQYFFRAADYAVCAYRSGLNSGAAALAMSFGVPIIAPRTATFADILARGGGIGYAPDDPGGLAAALRRALEIDPSGMNAHANAIAEEDSPLNASTRFFEGLTAGLKARRAPA